MGYHSDEPYRIGTSAVLTGNGANVQDVLQAQEFKPLIFVVGYFFLVEHFQGACASSISGSPAELAGTKSSQDQNSYKLRSSLFILSQTKLACLSDRCKIEAQKVNMGFLLYVGSLVQ